MSDSSYYPNSPSSSASAASSSSLASDQNAASVSRALTRNENIEGQHLSDGEVDRGATSNAADRKDEQLVPQNQSRKRAISSKDAEEIDQYIKRYHKMPSHVREALKAAQRQADLLIRQEEVKRLRRGLGQISDNDSEE